MQRQYTGMAGKIEDSSRILVISRERRGGLVGIVTIPHPGGTPTAIRRGPSRSRAAQLTFLDQESQRCGVYCWVPSPQGGGQLPPAIGTSLGHVDHGSPTVSGQLRGDCFALGCIHQRSVHEADKLSALLRVAQ